jgi:hypothetical protein
LLRATWGRDQEPPIPDPAPAAVVGNLNGRYAFFHKPPPPLAIGKDGDQGREKKYSKEKGVKNSGAQTQVARSSEKPFRSGDLH